LEVPNYYSAFTALAIMLLSPNGEMAAILPRSFCNGTYFTRFRKFLLENMSLRHLHVFETRKNIFEGDVLQENIVLYAAKNRQQEPRVTISTSRDAAFRGYAEKKVPFTEIVRPCDQDCFINIPVMETDKIVMQKIGAFQHTLEDLEIHVGTGPVVDFRLSDSITAEGKCPLIYPYHFEKGLIVWPKAHAKKTDRILHHPETQKWLLPNRCYTLVKRFSAKEEQRRIVAAVYHPPATSEKFVGIENHLNVFLGTGNRGLCPQIATGLAVYLNSTLVDLFFRQFSGHTQVNAADLRRLTYPDQKTLRQWGTRFRRSFPKQEEIDEVVDRAVVPAHI
jgi:adenine-specific DNA-methyltransferase